MNTTLHASIQFSGTLVALPSLDCDEAWTRSLLPHGSSWRPKSTRSHQLLSTYLKQKLNLDSVKSEIAQLELDECCKTIATLPVTQLLHLIKHIGATIHGEEVRRAIAKADVIAYRNQIGEALYRFIMERAPLLWRNRNTTAVAHPATLPQRILTTGCTGIRIIYGDNMQHLCRRILLRLPPENHPQEQQSIPSTTDADVRRLILRLQRELNLFHNISQKDASREQVIC